MDEITITGLPLASGIDATADWFAIDRTSLNTTQRINRNTMLGIAGSPVGTSDSQTLTNKIITTPTLTVLDNAFTLQDNSTPSKQVRFELSGLTSSTTRTLTVPDANLTIVGTATTQTLTNKTLTSPIITGGTIDNSTVTVDSIAGHTVAGNGTVYGLAINSGVLQTANSVTATNLASNSVTTAKIVDGNVTAAKLATTPSRFVAIDPGISVVSADPANTNWTAVDITANTSATATAVSLQVGVLSATSTSRSAYFRPTGSSSAQDATTTAVINQVTNVTSYGSVAVKLDASQSFDWSVSNSDVSLLTVIIKGYWETVA